ncbi:MAG: hypothetical protein LPK26_05135 [Bacillaceae bacterium]|nr:hypothetical protein [Bacillaceae bacterium]
MKLILLEQVYELNNDENSINQMFNRINSLVNGVDVHLSHLVVNGEDVYENHGEYILDQLSTIETVEVIVQTTQQLINHILLSTESYLNRAIPEVKSLVDEFYNNPIEESWTKLSHLLEGVQWIIHMVHSMDQLNHQIESWNEYLIAITTLEGELSPLLEAIENKDMVLIADIVHYEVLPVLESIQLKSTTTINLQGDRFDIC